MSDFLEVAEEHCRVLDVAVRGALARHAPLTVEVLALERGLDLALHDIDDNTFLFVDIIEAATAAAAAAVAGCTSMEARGLSGDFGAYVLVEDRVPHGGDFWREGGVGELGGELGGDLWRFGS